MGYIRHHAILVTIYDMKKAIAAQSKANEIFGDLVSGIVSSNLNGYVTFFIAPDGSKEGWAESNNGDENREKFINYLDEQAFEDGSNSYSYAELFYGDDEGKCEIVKHN